MSHIDFREGYGNTVDVRNLAWPLHPERCVLDYRSCLGHQRDDDMSDIL